MNPTATINIHDMPQRLNAGFVSLPTKGPHPAIATGDVVTEVGEPIVMLPKAYCKPILAFQLRKKRKVKLPDHMFGKMDLGQAFSAFVPSTVSVPPVGTEIILDPVVTYQQSVLMNLYRHIQADTMWIIHTPCPFGTALLLEANCPEIDARTKTRGVRWKPAGVNTIAFYVPWSSDVSVVDKTIPRSGQSGLSLKIRTVEDNTTDTVNTPLLLTVYQVTFNVRMNGQFPNDTTVSYSGLNFTPADTSSVIEGFEERSDSPSTTIEVQAEGVGNVAEQIASTADVASNLAVEAEAPMAKPTVSKGSVSSKNQTGVSGTRWFEINNITVNATAVNTWVNLTTNPSTLNAPGENISLAYRRAIWVAGNKKIGYSRTLRIKVVVSRPGQISGCLEFSDSRNISSRYFVEFGGNVEFVLIPQRFSSNVPSARPRYPNNEFLRTDEAMCDWKYRVVGFNRTGDIADVNIRLLVRQGDAYFHTPTKPTPPPASDFVWMIDQMNDFIEQKEDQISNDEPIEGFEERSAFSAMESQITDRMSRISEEVGPTEVPTRTSGDDVGENTYDVEDAAAPLAGETSYGGEINPGGALDEDLDQDDFIVQVFEGTLPVGSVVTLPMNFSVIPDLSGTGGISTIAQKFERNAHVIPMAQGNMGPQIGSYAIELRLPTTIAGQISHVSVPGDMTDEAAIMAFGLGDLLSLATTAIQAVGGPALSGLLGTGRAVLQAISSIGGKNEKESKSDSSNSSSLSGPLEVSRFINFLKPILANETADPTFGQLLINARDFIGSDGSALTGVPARVWARMDKSGIERQLFDRIVTPSSTMVNEAYIPYDRWGYIISRFVSRKETFVPGTHQNACFFKFLSLFRLKAAQRAVVSLSLNEILNYEMTPTDWSVCKQMILSKRLSVLP